MDTMHKPRLNMHTQKHTRPNRLCTWKTTNVQRKCQGSLQLLSPPFLMTSTTKQMQPNGKEVTHGGGRSATSPSQWSGTPASSKFWGHRRP